MWNYISLSQTQRNAVPPVPSVPLVSPRYTAADAVIYVLTLCGTATVISFAKSISVQRWLGTQWVLGWFALDAVWNPTSTQPSFKSITQYLSFLFGLIAHIVLLYYVKRTTLDYVNIAIVSASVIFWCVIENIENTHGSLHNSLRVSAKITALYATAAVIALVSGVVFDFKVEPPSWFYYFVAIQYSGVPHGEPHGVPHGLYTHVSKFLHAWIWAVLVYDLATDQLDFSVWF